MAQWLVCRTEEMQGGNPRLTSIPSRGSRNTPSRFMLRKPEISVGTDEPWGRLLPTPPPKKKNGTLGNIPGMFIVPPF